MKLLDTSVAIDHLRGYLPATTLLEDLLRSEDAVAASELTRFELLAGVRPDGQADLERFFLVADWVPVTEDIVRRASSYARSYRRIHSGIGAVDYLIAGTAATLDTSLLSTNVRHFPCLKVLKRHTRTSERHRSASRSGRQVPARASPYGHHFQGTRSIQNAQK